MKSKKQIHKQQRKRRLSRKHRRGGHRRGGPRRGGDELDRINLIEFYQNVFPAENGEYVASNKQNIARLYPNITVWLTNAIVNTRPEDPQHQKAIEMLLFLIPSYGTKLFDDMAWNLQRSFPSTDHTIIKELLEKLKVSSFDWWHVRNLDSGIMNMIATSFDETAIYGALRLGELLTAYRLIDQEYPLPDREYKDKYGYSQNLYKINDNVGTVLEYAIRYENKDVIKRIKSKLQDRHHSNVSTGDDGLEV